MPTRQIYIPINILRRAHIYIPIYVNPRSQTARLIHVNPPNIFPYKYPTPRAYIHPYICQPARPNRARTRAPYIYITKGFLVVQRHISGQNTLAYQNSKCDFVEITFDFTFLTQGRHIRFDTLEYQNSKFDFVEITFDFIIKSNLI